MAPKAKGKAKAKSAAPKAAAREKEAGEILKVFQAYDTNGDGTVSLEELGALLQTIDKETWDDANIAALFKEMDADNDGRLESDEFVRWITKRPAGDKQRLLLMSAPEQAAATNEADLNAVLAELFQLYDMDEDGQIERMELLDVEEMRLGKMDFGPKQRKAIITWFKESGAEGTPVDGMYLSKDNFVGGMVKLAADESGIDAKEAGKIAAWIRENRLAPVKAAMEKNAPPPTKTSATSADATAVAATGPPEYPITVKFTELGDHIKTAASFRRSVLVVSSGLDEVETWMSYQTTSTIDCKQLISEMFVSKTKSKETAQSEVKTKLMQAMNSSGFTKPLWIRLSNSAFDWVNVCSDGGFPKEVFSGSMWTPAKALELGIIDPNQKQSLEIDEKKWSDFQVQITSSFDLAAAKEHLADKLPFFDELAIIVVDPASIAK